MKVHSDYGLLSSKNEKKSQEMIIEAHFFKPSIAILIRYLLKPGLNVQD